MTDSVYLRYTYHDAEKDKHYAVSLRLQGFDVVMMQDKNGFECPAPVEKQSEDIQRLSRAFQDMMVEFWK